MYPRKNNKKQFLNTSNEKTSAPKYYSDKEQDSKKKLIVVKVLEDIKKRHKKTLERFNLSDKFLKQGLHNLIKEENLIGFDYSKFLNKVEQDFLIDYIIKSSNGNANVDNYLINNNTKNTIINNEENKNSNNINNRRNSNDIYSNKNNYRTLSPRNNNNNNNNGVNYNHSNAKYEELKNIKEKDEWGILAKKNYMEYLEDRISRLQQKEEKKKEITEILAKQILEKNQQKQIRLTNEERFFEGLTKDVENWKKSEIVEKEKYDHKIKDFIEKRDNVMKSK